MAASQQDEENQASDTAEFTIKKIVNHKRNRSREHQYAKYGETLFRIRWYGYAASADTPIRHIPRSKVISYSKRRKIPLPDNLDDAIDG